MTPERALTTVDLPCATWPMVPILMVACAAAAAAAAAAAVIQRAEGQSFDHDSRPLRTGGARQAPSV
jgi:hypothetical protein